MNKLLHDQENINCYTYKNKNELFITITKNIELPHNIQIPKNTISVILLRKYLSILGLLNGYHIQNNTVID